MISSIILALCVAQSEDAADVRARIAIAIALEQIREPAKAPAGVSQYETARQKSIAENRPLIVGIGCAPPRGNWLAARVEHLDGYAAPCIVVSRGGNWILTLGPGATAQDISRALSPTSRPRLVEVPLSPFQDEPPTADDEPEPLVSGSVKAWQWTDADIPEYMERYEPAKYTQRIFNTTVTERVPRTALEEKWQVPGGLAGLTGWRSALYRWAPHTWRRAVGNIAVENGFTHRGFDGRQYKTTQNETGYTRQYADGAEFLDVLTNTSTGRVFEVRKAMKANGSWQRFTIYRDRDHWPRGYKGPSKLDCHKCHNDAGTGGYAVGLAPGGDTVLSDPFPGLER